MKPTVFNFKNEHLPYPMYEDMIKLNAVAKSIAGLLNIIFKDKDLGLVCRGSSGMCLATALSQYNDLWHIIYIRKEGESPHCCSSDLHVDRGSSYAGDDHWTLVFVDDLIASGNTLYACAELLFNNYQKTISVVVLASSTARDFTKETRKKFIDAKIKMPTILISAKNE